MPKVLTMDSSILCDKPLPNAHGGNVEINSNVKLTVRNKPVLIKSSIEGKTVNGCSTPTNSTHPCATVSSVSGGFSAKITINQESVILDTVSGETDGNPKGTLYVKGVGHNKLTENEDKI